MLFAFFATNSSFFAALLVVEFCFFDIILPILPKLLQVIEIFGIDETNALRSESFFEFAIVVGMSVCFGAKFARFGEFIFKIEVANERSGRESIVAITKVAIDANPASRRIDEVEFIFVGASIAFASSAEIDPEAPIFEHLRSPVVELGR